MFLQVRENQLNDLGLEEEGGAWLVSPDLISILVAESIQYLEPWGAFNGIMVGTATEPAVILKERGQL